MLFVLYFVLLIFHIYENLNYGGIKNIALWLGGKLKPGYYYLHANSQIMWKPFGVVDIDPEYCRMAAQFLKKESSNLFLKTELIFEKMVADNSGRMQVCEDQALYEVRSARNKLN